MFYRTVHDTFVRFRDISSVYIVETKALLADGCTSHFRVDASLINGASFTLSPLYKNDYARAKRFLEDFMAELIITKAANSEKQ